MTYSKIIDYHENGAIDSVYYENKIGRWNGLYISWDENGNSDVFMYFKDDDWHGERIEYDKEGDTIEHDYYADNKHIIDLLEYPVTDPEEKMLLKLKHGGDWLPDNLSEICNEYLQTSYNSEKNNG